MRKKQPVQNPVAKFAPKFHRHKVERVKTRYTRKSKHKGAEMAPFLLSVTAPAVSYRYNSAN